ncbi:hypothetical protein WMF39_25710 [Sorangium sp. So ce1504]|uniref:hypothetical protein n=1 Tax=Sorangium sp. So ce1504 TaxID=3133337 RepID=UPI003F622D32
MDDGAGLTLWNGILGAALEIPGARVDRASFLRSALARHVAADAVERAVAATPAKARILKSIINKSAQSSIAWHRAGVSATSAIAGLPGGWWIAGTIPADLAQYFWHVVVVLQKLAYLHGWPSLFQDDEDIDDETKLVLTLFIGVMLGAQAATNGLSKLATAMGGEVAKRLPRAPLTKYAVYQIAKQVAKWIGVRLTKKKFAELVGRAVPIIGGGVAGVITWIAFGGGAKRLLEHLEGLPLAES